jgi:PAS domain S-box-containing protein
MRSETEIATNSLFVQGSEMGDLMRAHDWSQTPLGETSGWSQSLKTVLSILLTSQHPIFLWWGEELIQFYNDAYRPILGTTKHPQALGQRGQECWQEIWDVIAPTIAAVMQRGESTRIQDGLLMLERNGYLEECYFNYAYSPVRNEAGEVGGVFCVCDETTKRVVGERQLKTLRELAAQPLATKTVEEAGRVCMSAIAKNPADIPFALLYLMDEPDKSARLIGTAGIESGTIASPEWIDLATHPWNLYQSQRIEQTEFITDLATRFDSLPDSIWNVPPQSAIVVPLKKSGQQQIFGFLILAVSPRRAFDDDYRGFFEVIASQVEIAIANARAHEEERQRSEALAALDRAKTEFFSNVSHEFRTPLTLMLSPLADTLANLDGSLPPQERERLQLVQRNGNRLLKLVNSLLDFSRLEAGRERVVAEPVDLATYTADLASAFRSTIEQAGLSLLVECPPLPAAVWIDRQMWEKIVLNLLSNAFKFTLAGRITVRLEWCGDRVELTVADTGVGIPERELPLLFDRFHRVENSQGRSFEGSGIGLSLVQELVQLQGGAIEVASTLGQGSCFKVAIPTGGDRVPGSIASSRMVAAPLQALSYVEEARRWLPENGSTLPIVEFGVAVDSLDLPALQLVAPAQAQLAPTDRATILLVDDNADMRDYIRRLLSGTYTVDTAADGVAALEAIERNPPDLVLTDVMMPRMDGFELLRSLRSNAATQDIPIVLLSARAGEESQIEGLEAGADDYLIKPFSARELVARVEATLKLAQLRRTASERERALQLETDTARANLDRIVSSLRDGFATFDRQWRYTYINDRLLEFLNLPRTEVIGRKSWDVFPHQVGIEFYALLNRAMTEQVEVQFEFYYSIADCWVEHRIYPTTDGIAILMADISDRKCAELMLVEQKRLLELTAAGEPLSDCLAAVCAAVSNLSLGVRACILPTDTLRQQFPRSISSEFPPAFVLGLEEMSLDELESGICAPSVDSGRSVTCADIVNDEQQLRSWRDLCAANGILACHCAPILGADDRSVGALMLCFDRPRMPTEWEYQLAEFGTRIASIVFERDRVSLALRASEAKYRTLFESLDAGICICEMLFDENGRPDDYRFLEVNSLFGNLTGLTEATGKTARELIPNLEADWFELYGRVVQTGEPVRLENQSIAMNRWFDVNAFPTGAAHSNQFAVLFTNITDRKQIEQALQESEQKNRNILESISDAFFALDENWLFTYVNGAAEIMLDRAPGDLIGKNLWTEYPGLNGSGFERVYRRTADERVADSLTAFYPDHDRWYEVRTYPAANGIAIYFQNVTDRKQAEIALQESEQRLRVSQLAAKIGTWDWDVAAGSVIWSPEYYTLYGLDPAMPSTYENWLATVIEVDRSTADLAVRTALQQQQTYLDFEFRSCHPTEGIRWFSSRSQIFYDADGQPLRAIGISIDITDRKQIEQALRQSEQRFRNMADNAPLMVWVTDATGYCTYLSRSWYEFSGQTEAGGLGFGWLDATHPDDRELARDIFLSANSRQEAFQLEYRLRHQNGEYRACLDVARPWFGSNGEFNGYIGSVIDIDDRKRAEATLAERAHELANLNTLLAQAATLLDERNQELDRFVHIVAHDLKAPLRAISNLSEWIEEDLEGSLTADTQQQMDRLRGRVRLMESTINGLLDYARAGRTDATTETVVVAELLAETIDAIAPPPTFEITIAPGMPTLQTKRLLLSQVFANLIGNAFKHHDRDDGTICISSQDQGDFYEFAIADDGPGIAPEDRDRVFVIFQAANPQQNPDSSGIGLAIVKKIVETAGGQIRLESELGRGTTFYFTWPTRS